MSHNPSSAAGSRSATVASSGAPKGPGAALPVVPGYQIAHEIARGGMGVVFAAHDPVFGRTVAVKVMHPDQDANRFVVEARVTAQLPHPGVPPVYALGRAADGRPFLAMKLIEGRTLADDLRTADRSADLPRLLDAFERICLTVGFAHSKGVVHRDLKPSNIMVGSFGEVLVLDWGLAKELRAQPAAGGADETVAGQVKGTPAYMAPEQARGEPVDARADVFALGGILAVILTGKPPFVGTSVIDTVMKASLGEVAGCFSELDACGADEELVALAKRCLAPRPEDRFADGARVAGASAAYRAGVEERLRDAERDRAAAEARAEEEENTRREAEARARAQRKKQQLQLALAGVLIVAAVAGGATAWWVEKQSAERAAERRREEAAVLKRQIEDDRRAAEAREREARNRAALTAALDRTEAALRGGDAPTAALALADVGRRRAEGGAGEFAARIERCRTDLAALEELDRIEDFRWTPVARRLPDRAAVADRWGGAFAAFGVVPGSTAPAAAARALAASLVRERLVAALDLWLVFAPVAGLSDVLRAADPDEFRDAVRAALGAGHLDGAAALAARPAGVGQPVRFAVALASNPSVPTERAREILERAAAERPNELAVLMGLGDLVPRGRAGISHRLRWYQAATSAHPRYASAHVNLGVALAEAGHLDAAVATLRTAVACDPNNSRAHSNLAGALRDRGDLASAVASGETAVRLAPDDPSALTNLGSILLDAGDRKGAVACQSRAVELAPDNPVYRNNLGTALVESGQWARGEEQLREAIRLAPTDPSAHYNLGNALARQGAGDLKAAVAAYRKAIELDSNSPRTSGVYNNLGRALDAAGDHAGAMASYEQAIRLDPENPQPHSNLGGSFRRSGKLDDAVASYKRAIRLDPRFAGAHYHLGCLLLQDKDDPTAALAHLKEAVRLSPRYTDAFHQLGRAQVRTGDLDGAVASFKRALVLRPDLTEAKNDLAAAEKQKREGR